MSLDCVWDEVKECLGYPNINKPTIVDSENVNTASINMKTKEICISKSFLESFKMNLESAYKGIAAHEANHYVTCPFDLRSMLIITSEAAKTSKQNAQKLTNYFEDIVINLDLVERGIDEIGDVYKGMDSEHTIDETVKALYFLRTGLDFGVNDKKNIDTQALGKINQLNYSDLNISSLRTNAGEFAEIMNPLLEKDLREDLIKKGRKYAIIDENGFEDYSDKEVSEALDKAAQDMSPTEYNQVINVLKPVRKLDNKLLDYYYHLSIKYNLRTKDLLVEKGKADYSYSSKEWSVGGSVQNIDYFKSSGRFLPGLTKEKTFIEKPVKGFSDQSYILPDALILIDSSSSMANPSNEKSYAVLGSFIVANHYIKNNKKVGVLNFSTNTNNLSFTSDKKKILKSLLDFQGQGTSLDVFEIDKSMKNTEADVYLISDMMITEYDSIINYLSSNCNRANIFLIGDYDLKGPNNIMVHSIKDESDIPKIVIGDLKEVTKCLA